MTETVTGHSGSTKRSAAGFRGRKNAPTGLTIERVFSTEGVHPYDEVTWERRDVVQQNWKTGETVFEQRGSSSPSSGASTPRPSSPRSTSVARSATTTGSGASSSCSTGS